MATQTEPDIFEQTVPCSLVVGTKFFRGAVHQITESGGNRLTPRERVYRPGARVDSTGVSPDSWSVVFVFYNEMRERGVPQNPYPGEVNVLVAACKIQDTATLTLPTVGPKRVRAQHWTRTEIADRRDYATVEVTFLEDNEEGLTASSFVPPNARSAAKRLASIAVATLVEEGVWSSDVAKLEALAAKLEALALKPSDFIDDLTEHVVEVQNTIGRIEAAFLAPATKLQNSGFVPGADAGSLLCIPTAWRATTTLRTLSLLAATAVSTIPGRPKITQKRYPVFVSIFDVASDVDQPIDALTQMNAGLPNLLAIPPGTNINVQAS